MKKLALIFILLFCLINLTSAQITFNQVYQLDTFPIDAPTTEFHSVQADEKFTYVLGHYNIYTSFITDKDTSFLLTLDQNGNILHHKNLEQRVSHCNLVPIENDGFALSANFEYTDSLLLLKIYPLSDTVITIKKTIGIYPLTSGFRNLSITKDKHFLVAGGSYDSPNSGRGEFYMKLDSLGNVIWKHTDMSFYPDEKYCTQIQELKNGNYLLIGIKKYRNFNSPNHQMQGYFKILDTSGTILSTTYTDNNRLLALVKAVPLNDGSIVFLGYERNSSGPGSSDWDYSGYVCKYDSLGQLLWEYNMKNLDHPSDLIGLDDDNLMITFSRVDTIPSYNPSIDSFKAYGAFLKLASDGTKIWERKFSILDSLNPIDRNLYAIKQTTNGDFIAVGRTLYFPSLNHNRSGWIIRTDSFGCIVPGCQLLDNTEKQNFDDINQLTIFPNPTSGLINFRFEKPLNNGSIRIFNSLGQELKTQQITDNHEQINCSNWQNGMYFYGIYDDNRLVKTGQFLKQ